MKNGLQRTLACNQALKHEMFAASQTLLRLAKRHLNPFCVGLLEANIACYPLLMGVSMGPSSDQESRTYLIKAPIFGWVDDLGKQAICSANQLGPAQRPNLRESTGPFESAV